MATSDHQNNERPGPGWPSVVRGLGTAGFWIFLLLSSAPWARAQSAPSKEHQIKAAFLYNFTKFVEWPTNCFAGGDGPLVIGILGPVTFAKEVEKAVQDRSRNGRPFIVKRIEQIDQARTVQILFISGTEEKRLADALEATKGAAILTVGESKHFAKLGGMINFVPEGDKVRFQINAERAAQSSLKVSAQLLKLAKIVEKP